VEAVKLNYQELPDGIKKALKQAGDEPVDHIATVIDEESIKLIEEFKSAGIDMYELTDE
jgi:TRAP-type C4-dicarboxylate transport system substrate-binding protein